MGKFVGACLLGRLIYHSNDLILALALQVNTVSDIFTDAAREEDWLLLDDSDLVMVPLWVQILDVLAIEKHFTFDRVVEALEEGDDRGLSAAARSTECHNSVFVIVNGKAYSAENGSIWLAGIVEFDIFHFE